ncbi:MAG: hypothetical protein U9N09_10510 [Euryarchaeota archaeon]|nr:hypothetical protein [Euryarchaeota archaeon]
MAIGGDRERGARTETRYAGRRRFDRAALDYVTGVGGAVTDSQSGFRALNRKAALLLAGALKVDDFSIESEMMRCSHDLNLRLAEVQIQCRHETFYYLLVTGPIH